MRAQTLASSSALMPANLPSKARLLFLEVHFLAGTTSTRPHHMNKQSSDLGGSAPPYVAAGIAIMRSLAIATILMSAPNRLL